MATDRSARDREVWRQAMRDVKPLRRGSAEPAAAMPEPEPPPKATVAPAEPQAVTPAPPPGAAEGGAARGLDKRSAQRLKRGHMPIEARLDLHGMTQEEAHRALFAFLDRASERGQRCLLVITGRGLRRLGEEGAGVLRQAVPRWLNGRRDVLAWSEAQPKDGGAGALYLLLRRRR